MARLSVEQKKAVRAYFDELSLLPASQWRERLDELCVDADVAEETLTLLRMKTGTTDHIQRHVSQMLEQAELPELDVGDTLGFWRLIEKIGSGGMGTVFLAERADGMYERKVAIKLLHGISDSEASQRLQFERQILAQMELQNVARLYDGGTTPNGNPYLVMEYVEGTPLNQYCSENGLSITDRVMLFLEICKTVQRAHEQLVLHCDLKPENILVDKRGKPVLLDFGVARMIGDSTVSSARRFTPAFASPELIDGRAVGTASDVFSLGVILLELLSLHEGARDQTDAMARLPLASEWSNEPESWRQTLRGDLDAIIAKATATKLEKRYATVSALANDLRHWQELKPVAARQGGNAYVVRRFIRRRWRSVAVAAGVFALSLVFVVNLKIARDEAQREARSAEETAKYLVSMFDSTDPSRRGEDAERPLTARELLDSASLRVQTDLRSSPELRGRLQAALGQAYQNLGINAPAEQMLQSALDSMEGQRSSKPGNIAMILAALSLEKTRKGDGASGLAMAQRGLDALESGGSSPALLASLHLAKGTALQNMQRYPSAEAELQRAEKHLEEVPSREEHELRTSVAETFALTYWRWGRMQLAEDRYRSLIADTPADKLSARHELETRLAQVLRSAGKFAEARVILEAGLPRAIALYGEDSQYVILQHEGLFDLYADSGEYVAADREMKILLERLTQPNGQGTLRQSMALYNYAEMLSDHGRYADAERNYREALSLRQQLAGADAAMTLRAEVGFANFLLRQGNFVEGRAHLLHAAEGLSKQLPPDSPARMEIAIGESILALHDGDLAKAGRVLAPYKTLDFGLREWMSLQDAYAAYHTASGRLEEALLVRKNALRRVSSQFGPQNVRTAHCELEVAEAQLALGQRAAAMAMTRSAIGILQSKLADDSTEFKRAQSILASSL